MLQKVLHGKVSMYNQETLFKVFKLNEKSDCYAKVTTKITD